MKLYITTIDSIDKKVDIVKIDVEGYEKKVLFGMNETVRKYRPLILIELNNNSREDLKFILRFMKDNNYRAISRNRKEDFLFAHRSYE